MAEDSKIFKITVLGGGGVGKSALTLRLITDNFGEEYEPTIEDLYRMVFHIDGQNITVDILDTAGQDDFSTMQDQWIREGDGFLIVYSVSSESSFNEAKQIYEKVLRAKSKYKSTTPIVLVGNKCDLPEPHEVAKSQGEDLARTWGIPFYETSAKTKINNAAPFYQVVVGFKANSSSTKAPKKKKLCTIL